MIIFQMNTYDVQETRAEVVWSPSIRIGYLIHLIVKLGFEFIFFYTVYWYQTRQTKVTLVDLNLTGPIGLSLTLEINYF